jgi:hypothetical protein
MPVHDWTKVDAGVFHDFHCDWIAHLNESLNGGLLPDGYCATVEQHARDRIADVLTLHVPDSTSVPAQRPRTGGIAVADAPPRVDRKLVSDSAFKYQRRRRTLAIRQRDDHRLVAVALLEIVSPGNKDRASSAAAFVDKVDSAIGKGINVLVADLFPPGIHDLQGIHGAIWMRYDAVEYVVPSEHPLTLASYRAADVVEAFVEHLTVGDALFEMPLFLDEDFYVNIPLEPTYQAAYRGVPEIWRNVVEGKEPTG